MEVSGRLLLPISQPIEYVRQILLHGRSLLDAPVAWGIGWLLVQPAVLVVVGAAVVWTGERIALRAGSLARY